MREKLTSAMEQSRTVVNDRGSTVPVRLVFSTNPMVRGVHPGSVPVFWNLSPITERS
jgi:hypothetical protein